LLEKIAGYSVIMQTYGESNAGSAELKKLDEETNRRLAELRNQQTEFDRVLSGEKIGHRGAGFDDPRLPKGTSGQLRETTVGVDSKLNARLAAEAKMLNESNLAVVNLMKSYEDFGDKIINIKEDERKAMAARADAEQKAAYQANEIIVNLQKRSVLDKEQLDREREVFLLRKDNKNLNNTELEYAQKILEIRNKYADEERNINEQLREGTQEHNAALERNHELRQRSIEQARQVLTETRRQTEGTMMQGVQKGFDEYIKGLPNQLEVGRRSFVSLMGSMENAVEQFVRTGKFNFGDFTRSVIMDMMVIQAKAGVMGMMRGFSNIFTPGSVGGVSLGETPVPGTSMTGFADGGEPPVGRASIVGERGPELFVPRTAGTIIPNNQLANAMGGGQTVNYNGPYIASMSAIDTQTGIQFLAKNKQTIWASYQSANRSVPVSR
jgi:lambda family phage tail tape measure protein